MIDQAPIQTPLEVAGKNIGLLTQPTWVKWLTQLSPILQFLTRTLIMVTAGRTLGGADQGQWLVCTGTFTLTMPNPSTIGDTYSIFNYGSGTVTIAGNVNGDTAGYKLVNQYQYVRLTSVDGVKWIVTGNN